MHSYPLENHIAKQGLRQLLLRTKISSDMSKNLTSCIKHDSTLVQQQIQNKQNCQMIHLKKTSQTARLHMTHHQGKFSRSQDVTADNPHWSHVFRQGFALLHRRARGNRIRRHILRRRWRPFKGRIFLEFVKISKDTVT